MPIILFIHTTNGLYFIFLTSWKDWSMFLIFTIGSHKNENVFWIKKSHETWYALLQSKHITCIDNRTITFETAIKSLKSILTNSNLNKYFDFERKHYFMIQEPFWNIINLTLQRFVWRGYHLARTIIILQLQLFEGDLWSSSNFIWSSVNNLNGCHIFYLAHRHQWLI